MIPLVSVLCCFYVFPFSDLFDLFFSFLVFVEEVVGWIFFAVVGKCVGLTEGLSVDLISCDVGGEWKKYNYNKRRMCKIIYMKKFLDSDYSAILSKSVPKRNTWQTPKQKTFRLKFWLSVELSCHSNE